MVFNFFQPTAIQNNDNFTRVREARVLLTGYLMVPYPCLKEGRNRQFWSYLYKKTLLSKRKLSPLQLRQRLEICLRETRFLRLQNSTKARTKCNSNITTPT